jgi:hypothetical protein
MVADLGNRLPGTPWGSVDGKKQRTKLNFDDSREEVPRKTKL